MARKQLAAATALSIIVAGLAGGCEDDPKPRAVNSPLSTPHVVATAPDQGTQIPELTLQDETLIETIAFTDPRLMEIIGEREYEVGDVFLWHTERDLQKLGGGFVVTFSEPFSYEGSWPAYNYDQTESVWPPLQTFTVHFKADDIRELRVMVDLVSGVVAGALPDGAQISDYTPPSNVTPFPTSATPRSD